MSSYVRDPEKIRAVLKLQPDGSIITTSDCKILIPERYVKKGLAVVGNTNATLGIFALVLPDGTYAVFKVLTMVSIDPVSSTTVKMPDGVYREFEFFAGGVLFKTDDVVVTLSLVFDMFDFFIDGAYIPWFMNYDDVCNIFGTFESSGVSRTKRYNGVNVGVNRSVIPLLASFIARDPDDKTRYYRQLLNDHPDPKDPVWVPFKSVLHGPKTTTAKLMGAYFDEGLTSALNNHNEQPEQLENILRA